MDNAALEKNDLLIMLSKLEEEVASAGSERELLHQKVTLLSQEKTAVDNELALWKDSLKTSEEEKQVCSVSNRQKYFHFLLVAEVFSFWRAVSFRCLLRSQLLFLCFQKLWDQLKRESSDDSKLKSLENMLHESENKYQVSIAK